MIRLKGTRLTKMKTMNCPPKSSEQYKRHHSINMIKMCAELYCILSDQSQNNHEQLLCVINGLFICNTWTSPFLISPTLWPLLWCFIYTRETLLEWWLPWGCSSWSCLWKDLCAHQLFLSPLIQNAERL